jgi:uncharacterized protein (TIGR03435 family)
MLLRAFAMIALMAGEGSPQPATKLEFEVASVKQNTSRGSPRLRYTPTGVDFAGVPLVWIIGEAYEVPYSRISSSDPRLNDRFFSASGTASFYDIAARSDHPVPKESIRLMLRGLLESRFKLVAHRDSRRMPVYEMVVSKNGSKLKLAESDGEPSGALGLSGFVCRNLEMARFASMLSIHMDRPVIDRTGLDGTFDFTLKPTASNETGKSALTEWFATSIFADLQRQLGLELRPDKASVDYLIVDAMQQPSEN